MHTPIRCVPCQVIGIVIRGECKIAHRFRGILSGPCLYSRQAALADIVAGSNGQGQHLLQRQSVEYNLYLLAGISGAFGHHLLFTRHCVGEFSFQTCLSVVGECGHGEGKVHLVIVGDIDAPHQVLYHGGCIRVDGAAGEGDICKLHNAAKLVADGSLTGSQVDHGQS